jgi:hypothetical protein
MSMNLKDVGMDNGQQYEVILTTKNNEGTRNAAPFGTIAKGTNEIVNRIFNGSKTLENILENREFMVNITSNPIYFTLSLLDNIPNEYYVDDESLVLKDVDGYFKAIVNNTKKFIKKDDPISPVEAIYICSDVKDIVKNKSNVVAMNRGIHCIIESLVNYSRVDKVDEEQLNYYLDRFRENERVIKKVGSKEDKLAIKMIKESLNNKGYEI